MQIITATQNKKKGHIMGTLPPGLAAYMAKKKRTTSTKSTVKKSGTYKGKSNAIGGGGRFAQVTDAVMKSNPPGGIKEAKAIAAIQGRKALGAKKFNSLGAKARKKK